MLLVGPPIPDRSRVMTQTKRDTLALQVGGLGVRLTTSPIKKYCYETSRGGQGPPRAVEPMMMMMMMQNMVLHLLQAHSPIIVPDDIYNVCACIWFVNSKLHVHLVYESVSLPVSYRTTATGHPKI